MKTVVFKGVELHIDDNNTLTTNEVAAGYGVTPQSIREHKRHHADEIFENVHYIVKTNKFNKPSLHWTIEGAYMLGFFIKSKEAKEFRKFTAKLLSEIKKGNAEVISVATKQPDPYIYQLERENIELKRTINRLTRNTDKNQPLKRIITQELDEMAYQLTSQFTQMLQSDIKMMKEAIETSVIMMHKKITHKERQQKLPL